MSGRRPPTLHDVRAKRRQILQVLASHGGTNPRVFGNDLQRVWEIVRDHLPALRQAVVQELGGFERNETDPG